MTVEQNKSLVRRYYDEVANAVTQLARVLPPTYSSATTSHFIRRTQQRDSTD